MTTIPGFQVSAVAAGVKVRDRLDLGLIFSEVPAVTAAVFTQNRFIAAPLIVSQRNLSRSEHRMRALLVNSGNANAATGESGIQAAQTCVDALSSELRCASAEVIVSSTGVIGRPLPTTVISSAVPGLVRGLKPDRLGDLARAIMTTDTVPKMASAEFGGCRIAGVAKGAGMIHPDMATMLSFLMTDAAIPYDELDRALRYAVHHSFNSISIDGDTSTNDMVVLMANGVSGARVDFLEFQERLREVCTGLAKAIVRDGEGATKFVELIIEGAASEEHARIIGRTIARSPLVKTAIHGADPNWGRIVGAIGNAGVPLSSDRVDIYIGGVLISDHNLEKAREKLSEPEIQIRVLLHSGKASATVWTCDLTDEYIRINADYTT
jgi:glutamate N-acetyltransferase/amino-acid N-acetyltransferase